MRPSPRPSGTAARLSTALRNQLNMYSLAASAAGVGVLALAQPAEARIVYTKTHHVIGDRSHYLLSLANTTAPEFDISNNRCPYLRSKCDDNNIARLSVQGLTRGASLVVANNVSYFAAALKPGTRISKERTWDGGSRYMLWQCSGFCTSGRGTPTTRGEWNNVNNRYLGLRFTIDGKVHYGWARLSVKNFKYKFRMTATLMGYAYETIPNKPIIAGKTKGPDVITVQPTTLGELALGRK